MFERAEQPGLVDYVVNQIETAIIDGRLAPGEKLPATAALQEMLGASRGTLREAFRVLGHKGLVRAKSGAGGGIFVREPSTEPMGQSLALLIRTRSIPLEHLAGFREGLEGCAAELAATHARPEDIARLEELLAGLEELAARGLAAWDEFHDQEARLHEALGGLSGNPLYEMNVITVQRNIGVYYGRYLPRSDKVLADNIRDWRAIIAALAQSKGGRVREMVVDHIRRFNRDMMAGGRERELDA